MSNLTLQDRQLLASVYAPPADRSGWRLEQLAGDAPVRYFAYGRHALAAALQAAGTGAGDRVLLPAFICREVLSAVHAVGARPAYYAVDRALGLAEAAAALPPARAIVAVDYFGFAQDLTPFAAYCARSGAVLIEDNAHGLFSRDDAGRMLGTRGDLGLFSIRKTLAAPDGAALVFNKAGHAPPQLPFDSAAPAATSPSKSG